MSWQKSQGLLQYHKEALRKQQSTLNEVEIPELPWQTVEEGINGLREVGCCNGYFIQARRISREVCYLGKPRGHVTQNMLVWRNSAAALLCRPGVTAGKAVSGSLRVLGVMWGLLKITAARDFPGSPGVKNLLCSARDMGLICGWRTKIPHFVDQLLSLQLRPDVVKTKYKRIFFF